MSHPSSVPFNFHSEHLSHDVPVYSVEGSFEDFGYHYGQSQDALPAVDDAGTTPLTAPMHQDWFGYRFSQNNSLLSSASEIGMGVEFGSSDLWYNSPDMIFSYV